MALKEFFAKWNPDNILSNTLLQPYLDEFSGAANLTFMVEDEFINNDQDIAEAWDEYYAHDTSENEGVCLVTGKKDLSLDCILILKELPEHSHQVLL